MPEENNDQPDPLSLQKRNISSVMVTGGTGFLGSYIIKNLVEKGYRVRAIRRSPALPFYIPKAIFDQVQWVDGDVLDIVSLTDAMQNTEGVIHSAAVVSFTKSNRRLMYQVNVEGTENVVNAALESGVKRMVHVSSIAAIGRTQREELINEAKKWETSRNNTHYAISKHHAEMHVWRSFAEGLEGAIINPSTILGYGDWHKSSCAIFRNAYKQFGWYSKGINGFVGVEDVAEAAVQLLDSGIDQKKFIVSSENWVFQQLFNSMADHFQKKRPAREATKTLGEIGWRLESLKSFLTGKPPLLTRETAKVAQSKTSWDGTAILKTLPGFSYTPLEKAIKNSCEKYLLALQDGTLRL